MAKTFPLLQVVARCMNRISMISSMRDRNAALNILNLGLSAQPRVDESRAA